MTKTRINVEGLDELMDKLDSMVPDLDRHLRDTAGPDIAHRMYANAAKLTPVDTGHLRQSLETGQAQVEGFYGQTFIGITTAVEYARYVEYGTGTKGDPKVPHVPKDGWWAPNPDYDPTAASGPNSRKFIYWRAQSPKPFLRNALKQTRKDAVKIMTASVDEVFKQ